MSLPGMVRRGVRAALDVWESLGRPDPGTRKGRIREAELLLALEMLRRDRTLTREQAERDAHEALQARGEAWLRRLDGALKRLARTSVTVPRRDVCQEVEIHAVLQLAQMRWWWDWMCGAVDGRPGRRGRVQSVLCWMAWSQDPPDVQGTVGRMEGNAKVGWAFDWRTQGPALKTVYKTLKCMLARKDVAVTVHLNASLFKELAALRHPDGTLRHPEAGKYLAVDGSDVEAHIRQIPPRDREHEDLMRGDREVAEWGIYRRLEKVVRSVFGYKVVTISCLKLGLPMIWGVYGSKVSEQQATLRLLSELRRLYPDIDPKYLVADAGFDSNKFAEAVWMDHAIHPVIAAKRSEKYQAAKPWWERSKVNRGEAGVPRCAHGLMLYSAEGFQDAHERRKRGMVPFGPVAPDSRAGRLRWRCAEGVCKAQATKPSDYPRLYTFLPRAGDHRRAIKRQALMLRRLDIESLFALTKYFKIDGTSPVRAAWADDTGICWLISLHMLYLTARRLVHENGMYEQSLAEAEQLGVREIASPANPSPGPDDVTAARAVRLRRGRQGPARAPLTWVEMPDRRTYYHRPDEFSRAA